MSKIMSNIDIEEIEKLGGKLSRNISKGDSFSSVHNELNEALRERFGISLRSSIVKYCRDNFKDITPLNQPIAAEIVNQIILKKINEGEKEIHIFNPKGLYNLAPGLSGINVYAHGPVGGSFGAYNNGAALAVDGVTGRYCGNNAWKGRFILKGDVDEGCGLTNYGADFFVDGNALTRAFAQSRRGSAFVSGNLGDYSCLYMSGGIVISLGRKQGKNIGSGMVGGAIYILKESINGLTLGEGTKLVEELNEEDFSSIASACGKWGNEGVKVDSSKKISKIPIISFNGKSYPASDMAKIANAKSMY